MAEGLIGRRAVNVLGTEGLWEVIMPPIEVIYEKGVFRPLQPVELPEGAVGEVVITPPPFESLDAGQSGDGGEDGGESPGERAYRLLMEIARLSQAPPDGQNDVGVRHDEILYPKQGRMP
jgi:hypothetical protein